MDNLLKNVNIPSLHETNYNSIQEYIKINN